MKTLQFFQFLFKWSWEVLTNRSDKLRVKARTIIVTLLLNQQSRVFCHPLSFFLKLINYSCADDPISLHQLSQVHVF